MKKINKKFWIVPVIAAVATIATLQLRAENNNSLNAIEPAANETGDKALPTPAHPVFKKDDPSKVTTVIAETPQANDVNGAPRILKTDLGLKVSPLCFEQLFGIDGPKGPIDVTTCEKISGYQNIQTSIEDGRYRSLYEFPSEPDMPAEKGFSSYELLGDVKAGTAVQTYNESGGTGRFSSLIIVKLTGNILTLVDQIAGGDRCNNGLTEAKVENGKLTYSSNVTPGDFPTLAWGSDKGLKPYEDLEASAMSCFGEATFEDGQFSKITLDPDATKESGDWSEQYSKQKCFNEKFQAEIAAGHIEMTPSQFKTFMDGFLARCVK